MTTFCTPAEFAGTTITGAVLASDLTIPVASIAALKGNSVYPFYATLKNLELVRVTGDASGASPMTVVRGVNGTTAVAAAIGDTFEQDANAQNVKDLNTAVNSLEATILVQNVVTADTVMVANNQYLVNKGVALCAFALPATAPINSRMRIDGNPLSAGGWQINQAVGQTIYMAGGVNTTPGVTGHIYSGLPGSSVELRCIVANTTWLITNSEGDPSFN